MFISLKHPKDRPLDAKLGRRRSQKEIMDFVRTEFGKIADMRFILQDLSFRGFSAQRGFPIEFTVRGPDWDKLTGYLDTILARMRQSPNLVDVDTDYLYGQPEIQIIPLRDAAALHGVHLEDIGTVIGAMIGGVRNGKFTEHGRRNDIRVRVEGDYRLMADDIKKLYVRNNKDEMVRLADLVTVTEKKTLQKITRRDRERAIGVFANFTPGKSQQDAMNDVEKIAAEVLPAGYRIVWSGTAQTYQETGQSLIFALWLGIIVAYMVLGTQYNSFVHPFTVLLALPFSVTGALLAHKIFGQSINLYSFIGLILLMGIAKKNSILLVDFANQRRREGLNVHDAILMAGPQRLRPILMTSLTIIAAAIPSALGLGSGSEVRIPMSVVIVGGVLVSTLMTLFVVPCAYSLVARLEKDITPKNE